VDENSQPCPLCQQSAISASAQGIVNVRCDQCGVFDLTEAVAPTIRNIDARSRFALRAAVRQARESGALLVLDSENFSHEISAHKDLSLNEKLKRVISLAQRRSDHFGATVTLQPETEYLLFDAANAQEAWALVEQTEKDGLLTNNNVDQLYCGALTRKGWEMAEAAKQDSERIGSKASDRLTPDIGSVVFRVAFSFPGEARYRIGPVAAALGGRIGHGSIFYDDWYKAELARPDLDLLLQSVYLHAELVVICLCGAYEQKQWCGIEWRAVREIIKRREDRIMFLRLDDGVVPGTFSIDGYLDLRLHSDSEAARLIEQRATGRGTKPPLVSETPLVPDQTSLITANEDAQESPEVNDLVIDVYEINHGFGIRLHNGGCNPVEQCRVEMNRLDRFLPVKREFTQNPIEPLTVLYARQVAGGGTSDGNAFATCPTHYRSLGFQGAMHQPRKKPLPELTTEDAWIVEFTLFQQARAISHATIFIKITPGQKPALVNDPRREFLPVVTPIGRLSHLKNLRVQITPVLPIARARDEYIVRSVTSEAVELEKSSGHIITIPASRIADDLSVAGPNQEPRLLDLNGRLQWLSLRRAWRFLPEKPQSNDERQYGFSRATSPDDPIIKQLQERGQKIRFARRDRIARYQDDGYQVVYDESGLYLTHGDLVLIASDV
jgi:hypothetical protein